MNNALTVAVLGLAYASLFLLERALPLRRAKKRLLPRLLVNVAISATAFAAAGALRLNIPQAQVTIGIPAYSRPEDNALLHSLVMPFRPQRDYWQGPQGRRLRREPE